jgi:hypothetical protein
MMTIAGGADSPPASRPGTDFPEFVEKESPR